MNIEPLDGFGRAETDPKKLASIRLLNSYAEAAARVFDNLKSHTESALKDLGAATARLRVYPPQVVDARFSDAGGMQNPTILASLVIPATGEELGCFTAERADSFEGEDTISFFLGETSIYRAQGQFINMVDDASSGSWEGPELLNLRDAHDSYTAAILRHLEALVL